MSYQVKLTETVGGILANFHPELKRITRKALREIAGNPYLGKELQEELEGYLSYRFRRYRAVYTVDEQTKVLVIHLVGHRRNVYELLKKLIPAATD
jgi:mRNA-degrading endonuclease RelE of RelBE toxin-antitoxin system